MDDIPPVPLPSDLAARRPLARIVRIVGFVGLSCTDGSGCLPGVNGIDRMFSFLNLHTYGRTIVCESTVVIDEFLRSEIDAFAKEIAVLILSVGMMRILPPRFDPAQP